MKELEAQAVNVLALELILSNCFHCAGVEAGQEIALTWGAAKFEYHLAFGKITVRFIPFSPRNLRGCGEEFIWLAVVGQFYYFKYNKQGNIRYVIYVRLRLLWDKISHIDFR